MRDYSKVSSAFWTGKTGKALRGDADAQIVALYLMTSPHANMIGVFQCPLLYVAHETGSPFEGASKGLQRLIEVGFCLYDEESETVWVREMAKFQVGDDLKPNDNRVSSIQKVYDSLPETCIKQEFFDHYGASFHIQKAKPLRRPSKAPPKPGAGTGTETGDIKGASKEKNRWEAVDAAKCLYAALPSSHKKKEIFDAIHANFRMRSEQKFGQLKATVLGQRAKLYSGHTVEEVVAAFNEATAQGYQGIFFNKNKTTDAPKGEVKLLNKAEREKLESERRAKLEGAA